MNLKNDLLDFIKLSSYKSDITNSGMEVTSFEKSKFSLVPKTAKFFVFENVIVDRKTGVILNSNFAPILETLDEMLFWNPTLNLGILGCNKLFEDAISRKLDKLLDNINEIREGYLDKPFTLDSNINYIYLMHAFGWYPYGHLHDSIQRAFWFRDNLENTVAICSKTRKLVDFELHLQAAGIKSYIDPNTLPRFFKVPKMLYGTNPAALTSFIPESYNWLIDGYNSLFRQEVTTNKRIYLSRNHVKTGKRGVINEAELIAFLRNRGFIIFYGSESLKTTYTLFSNADLVISSHGSALVNTIFCQNYCRIVEFCPDNRVDLSFKKKFKRAENYEHYVVKSDSDYNINIELDFLAALLE
ncbi:glycosyltransferase 61 family protein [Paraglaciecola marina]|uniref:glycosyltransferase 61 family protein n=1 Tax=Paraglaciecola marina TaxID=2500157 RepID=UPI001060AB99|nr:glycosyltransferase family 61 protein [Paraglaciecola marina]